jgi:hypothetical protein
MIIQYINLLYVNLNVYLFSNVDFCDISQLPLIKNSSLLKYKQEMSYLHSMMWRWLPIGDSFVDLFISRDTDSLIIKREVDSVQVWAQLIKNSTYYARSQMA